MTRVETQRARLVRLPRSRPRPAAEIPGLTGLRAVAWAGVVVAHSSAHFAPDVAPGLHLGLAAQTLTLFFVLSGFLIYLPFATALLSPEPVTFPSMRRYSATRLFRIYPGYVAIFLLVNFVLGVSYLTNPTALTTTRSDVGTGTITDPVAFLLNLTLLNNFVPSQLQTGINPSWTLTVELSFYLLMPLVALVALALRRRWGGTGLWWALVPPSVLIAFSLVGRVVISVVTDSQPSRSAVDAAFGDNVVAVLQRSLVVFADNFGLGMLVCVAYVAARTSTSQRSLRRPLLAAYAALLFVSMVLTLLTAVLQSNLTSLAFGVFSAVAIAMMVLPHRLGGVARLGTLSDAGPMHFLGLISFSLYLWHFPVLLMMSRTGLMFDATGWGLTGNILVLGVITTVLSTLTYYGVERRGQALGKRLTP